MTMFLIIGILILGLGILFYNICRDVYTKFNHYGWEENSKPNKKARISNIDSSRVQYVRNGAKLKTKITFSDGFYFITYKTNRENSIFTYNIYLSEELKEQIISSAIEQHSLAVDKFINNNKSVIYKTYAVNNKLKKDITKIKIEIVNDEKYINLKSSDRIDYLNNQKKQTISELNKLTKLIELENNKIKDIPVDIAKYIKSNDIASLQKDVLKLENKKFVLDELISLEINDKYKKKEYEVLIKKVAAKPKDKEDDLQYWNEFDD